MKAATMMRLAICIFIIPFLVPFPVLQQAQAQETQAQDISYQEPSAKYSREELAQMLAPIALYPDALLSQVLMASTYPIEVIEADRWVRKNPDLKDESLDEALLAMDWDPSVKAICHVPSVLALMSERITETTNIGNAFLAQEEEVLDMVQELRAKAQAQGNLSTTKEQKVLVEKETIIIEQTDPRVIYVPYYDPWYIYGPWWYPAYPPYYWGPPGVTIGLGISYWPGIYFGFAYGTWSYFNWHQHYIYIDVYKRPRYVRHDHWRAKPGRWNHAPSHRRGVAYRDKPTARKYGQYHSRTREYRHETRGFPEPRDRDRSGIDNRAGIDRETRLDGRTKIERDQQQRQRTDIDRQDRERAKRDQQVQERPRVESERQARQRVESERQAQQRSKIEAGRQERQRIETGQELQQRQRAERSQEVQQRQRIEPERQERQRIETGQQVQQRQRVEPERQARQRIETGQQVQQRQRAERSQEVHQRTEQVRRPQERVERQQYQRGGDDVFNRVEYGRQERQSSERGRVSRQGPDNNSRGSNRSDSGNRGGQGGRERSGR